MYHKIVMAGYSRLFTDTVQTLRLFSTVYIPGNE